MKHVPSSEVDGVTVGGWSCGAPQSQSSGCVPGVAPGSHTDLQPSLVKLTRYNVGITFDIGGDALKDAQTCFCGSDLCNTADFTGTKTSTTFLALVAQLPLLPQSSRQFSTLSTFSTLLSTFLLVHRARSPILDIIDKGNNVGK